MIQELIDSERNYLASLEKFNTVKSFNNNRFGFQL